MQRFKLLGIILLIVIVFGNCTIFRRKNRCDDCPKFKKSAKVVVPQEPHALKSTVNN